jgi:hypothetical protein
MNKGYFIGQEAEHQDCDTLEKRIKEGCNAGRLPKNQQHSHHEDGHGEGDEPPELTPPQEGDEFT